MSIEIDQTVHQRNRQTIRSHWFQANSKNIIANSVRRNYCKCTVAVDISSISAFFYFKNAEFCSKPSKRISFLKKHIFLLSTMIDPNLIISDAIHSTLFWLIRLIWTASYENITIKPIAHITLAMMRAEVIATAARIVIATILIARM